ncbi:Neuraminidase [Frankliniella fusca]|uniref:Neuraminidase n=1 Tax=Frankliniella fusca TaxID=407009 RepID=A0AAE1L9Q5_9NEOP|nr:Neuraminidase [Frankliniella fusca]
MTTMTATAIALLVAGLTGSTARGLDLEFELGPGGAFDAALNYLGDDDGRLQDALLDVNALDGSTRLRPACAGTDDMTPVFLVPGLEAKPRPTVGVGDSLLNVLLAVNGMDPSLLSLNRVDDTLMGAGAGAAPLLRPGRACSVLTCRGQCGRHGCPGGYCDTASRCHCLC